MKATEKVFLGIDGEISAQAKRVFIVDDDDSVCRALGLLLISHGFNVTTFTSAEDFFSAVPNSVPGCLVLDIHLPGVDGGEALKRMINAGSRRPVIIITADNSAELGDRAAKSGVAGFFLKPIQDRELVDCIKSAA